MSKLLIPSQQIEELRTEIVPLKRELQELQETAKEIWQTIENGYFLPENTVEMFKQKLNAYNLRIGRIKPIAASLNIPMNRKIADAESAIQQKEIQLRIGAKQRILEDFFRITASSQSVAGDLEECKKQLVRLCQTSSLENLDFLKPYETVVRLMHSTSEEELSDEEFDIIEQNICRSVARALDRGALTFEPDQDLSLYMNGSCPLLTRNAADSVPSAVSNTENSAANSQQALPAIIEQSSQDNALLQWPDFTGYAGRVTISYKDAAFCPDDDTKFIEEIRQQAHLPFALYMIAHQKFVQQPDIERIAARCDVPADELYHQLITGQLITSITVCQNEASKTYFMLTSKAWTYYAQSKVVRYLNSKRPPTLTVPKQIWLLPEMLKPVDALRIAMIQEYFETSDRLQKIVVFPEGNRKPLFATGLTTDKDTFNICPAVLESGSEQSIIAKLCSMANSPNSKTLFLIQQHSDIQLLSDQLLNHNIQIQNIQFCVTDQSDIVYDWEGKLKKDVL